MVLAPSWLILNNQPSSNLILSSHFLKSVTVPYPAHNADAALPMSEWTTRISNLPKQESLSVFTQLHPHTVYSTTNAGRLPKCRSSAHSSRHHGTNSYAYCLVEPPCILVVGRRIGAQPAAQFLPAVAMKSRLNYTK
jgi:hypothetical protein